MSDLKINSKIKVIRVYPLVEMYKAHQLYREKLGLNLVFDSYESYLEYVRSMKIEIIQRKYTDQLTYFKAILLGDSVEWTIGPCSNMRPMDESDIDIFVSVKDL